MPDLAPGQPTGGPATPTKSAEPPLPIPAPPAALSTDDLASLSPEDIQARITARERDMKFRLQAIRHEVRSMGDDVVVGGRPMLDLIRDHKEAAIALALGAGALVGLLWGAARREKRRPDVDDQVDMIRVRMASLLEEAADRVSRGTSTDEAIDRAVRAAPVVYMPGRETSSAAASQAKSSVRQAVDLAVKSAIGFASKAAMDAATKKFTGHATTGEALKAADDDA